MSIQAVAKQFVELCNQGKNFDVMRTMYAPDVVSVEGDGGAEAGDPEVRALGRGQLGSWREGSRAVFNGPGEFAVHFTFEVTPKSTGKRITLQEVGVYTVKGDKITREQFFYDGER